MKNAIQFCTLATALCITLQANAQQNAFKLEGLSLLTGNITLSYERAVAPGFTLVGEYQRREYRYKAGYALGAWVLDVIDLDAPVYELSGHRLNLACRYYPQHKMQGFYVENGFLWGSYAIKEDKLSNPEKLFSERVSSDLGIARVLGVRSGIGIQFHADFLTVDVGAGLHLVKSNKDTDHIRGLKPVSPYLRGAIGFNF